MLTASDKQRIADAVTAAESKTSGEIFCVMVHEVSRYREVPLIWAALAAFCLPPLAVLAGMDPLALFSSWSDQSTRFALSIYSLIQAGLFLVVALLVSLPRVKRVMTPRFLKRHRVRQVARHHFVAAGRKLGHGAPHILIFASLWDRQVELVAHQAIHKAVGEGPWNAAVAAVSAGMKNRQQADGFIRAIEICGAALAAHFPPNGAPKNRLSNEILLG